MKSQQLMCCLINFEVTFSPIGDENVTTFVVTFMEILIFPNILSTSKVK